MRDGLRHVDQLISCLVIHLCLLYQATHSFIIYNIYKMSSGQLFKCSECDHGFTFNHNLTCHTKTVHGNDPRKDNEARKEEILTGLYSETFEVAGVGCAPQVVFQPPNEYVTMAMKEHHDKLLTSEEFMQATGLIVFKHITETFWTLMYERHISYIKVIHQVLQKPTEDYVKPPNYKHLLMRPLDFQVLAASVKTQKGQELTTELVKLGFVVHCYREYEKQVLQCQKQVLEGDKQVLEGQKQVLQGGKQVLQDTNVLLHQEKQSLEDDNTKFQKCKTDMTTNPMKDLTLKVTMFEDDKFAVIRCQRSHADVYQKKYMSQLRGPKKTVDFTKHPNAMSKWAKMRQLLSDHQKIKNIKGNLFKCVNDYDLSTLMKDLKIEHKQQCVMLLSGRTIDSYVKEKPWLHPDLADHSYCKVH